MRRKNSSVALYIIALIALALRFVGTEWGKPFGYHFDEPFIVKPALRIVETGDLNPHFFRYPSFMIYAESAVVAVARRVHDMPTDTPVGRGYGPSDLLPTTWPALAGGRRMVAVFGAVGVLAVGWLARAGGGPVAGILAALLLAVFPLHVEHSQYVTTDVPASTFLVLAFAALACVPDRRGLAAAGAALGLACATKYTAVIALPGLLLLSAIDRGTGPRASIRSTAWLLGATGVAFLLASPFALLDASSFLAELEIVRSHYTQGHFGAEGAANWGWYLSRLRDDGLGSAGMALIALGAAGVLVDAARMGRIATSVSPGVRAQRMRGLLFALVALGLAAAWLAWIGSVRVRFERNMMPSVVLACAAAGYGLAAVLRTARARSAALAGAALVAILCTVLAPARMTTRVLERLRAKDTRSLAAAWVAENVPPGSSVAREEFTPQLDADRYHVEYLWSLAQRDLAEFRFSRTTLLIASRAVYGRFLRSPHEQPQMLERYERIFSLHKAASFAPGPGVSGPVIDIFQVSSEDSGDSDAAASTD